MGELWGKVNIAIKRQNWDLNSTTILGLNHYDLLPFTSGKHINS